MGFLIIRVLFVLSCGSLGYFLQPWGLTASSGLGIGLAFAAAIIGIEVKLRRLTSKVLFGGLVGLGVGLLLALGFAAITRRMLIAETWSNFWMAVYAVVFGYLGMVVGAKKGEWMTAESVQALLFDTGRDESFKVLDTSVIIDGRILEICETGFIDGVLVVPQFVLRELQSIADSADSLKRNRGRRGLEILQKLQKNPDVKVQISETDFPGVEEVDLKLIELARQLEGKIVTNDFNLNKVAQLRGVQALNINELANSLKPVVLPGEELNVYLMKEGKEPGQGVGYLDDGTMVVVDSGKPLIGETVDIAVTSVLQTTAGKMIFGKLTDEGDARE